MGDQCELIEYYIYERERLGCCLRRFFDREICERRERKTWVDYSLGVEFRIFLLGIWSLRLGVYPPWYLEFKTWSLSGEDRRVRGRHHLCYPRRWIFGIL